MPIEEHRKASEGIKVRFCLIVTSDSIYEGRKEDRVTPTVKGVVTQAGHELVASTIIPNSRKHILRSVREGVGMCDVVLITGGTGLSRRDITVDVLRELCVKDVPGYGELFRLLTYQKHGVVAIASRALACVVDNSLVFTTPGSPEAVKLALNEVILPEIKHLVYELRR